MAKDPEPLFPFPSSCVWQDCEGIDLSPIKVRRFASANRSTLSESAKSPHAAERAEPGCITVLNGQGDYDDP